VEHEPLMVLDPIHDMGMFVGGVVVDNEVNRLFLGILASMTFRNLMNS
jgi:hypothetical protein